MTATLPEDVRRSFERFITTEYTTVDARQQPITWPVTPYYTDGGETIDVTTGVGYPKKADDAKRNSRVALLFSDPTGSDVDNPPRVLVQGTALVDEDDLVANRDRYLTESVIKLPATKKMHPPKFLMGPMNWYYARIYIKVRPERVFVWQGANPGVEPEIFDSHLEEVRSGHAEEPPLPHADATGGDVAWDSRITELGSRHESAVVSWVGPDGFPISVRLPIHLDPTGHRIRFDATPAGLPLIEGRACLAAHAHAPDFTWQENFQVRGDLVELTGGEWALVPRKLVGGFELPKGLARYRDIIKNHRRFYRTAKKRLG